MENPDVALWLLQDRVESLVVSRWLSPLLSPPCVFQVVGPAQNGSCSVGAVWTPGPTGDSLPHEPRAALLPTHLKTVAAWCDANKLDRQPQLKLRTEGEGELNDESDSTAINTTFRPNTWCIMSSQGTQCSSRSGAYRYRRTELPTRTLMLLYRACVLLSPPSVVPPGTVPAPVAPAAHILLAGCSSPLTAGCLPPVRPATSAQGTVPA